MAHSSQRSSNESTAIATTKRENYIDWETYFMATAFLARHRSKDPHCQVGACIVDDDKKIVGIGWNGFPTGVSDDMFTYGKVEGLLNTRDTYVCHAEANAITFRTTVNLKGCTMYVTRHPCNECAKIILQSGIKKVYYLCNKISEEHLAAQLIFAAVDQKFCTEFEVKEGRGKLVLEFSNKNLSNENAL